jgi:hypothetical protein
MSLPVVYLPQAEDDVDATHTGPKPRRCRYDTSRA